MILFTGLTGTSGSAFVDVLKSHHFREHFRVLVRKTSYCEPLKNSGLDFEFAYGSLDGEDSLVEAASGCDTLFHIAAKGKLKEICNAAIKSKTIKHCILVSSTSIYSSFRKTQNLARDEDIVKQQLNNHHISWTIIRPTMIFGSLSDCNISLFMKWLDKYPVFPIVKQGSALLQPVFRYDLAEAYFLILEHRYECVNEEFIVSGKSPLSLKESLRTISQSIGKKTVFVNVPFFFAWGGVWILYCISFGKKDYREKLYRLTEDRAFECKKMMYRFGYNPHDFSYGVEQLAIQFENDKKRV